MKNQYYPFASWFQLCEPRKRNIGHTAIRRYCASPSNLKNKNKEERTYVNYLVQAKSIERAKRYVDEVMGDTIIDYELKSLSETKIFDVFEHEPSTKQKEKDGKTE